MSRTRLVCSTALGLAAATIAVMVARRQVLGPEVQLPHGPDTWKVTMLVQAKIDRRRVGCSRPCRWTGRGSTSSANNVPATNSSCGRQVHSTERRPPDDPLGRSGPAARPVPFRVRYDCYCTVAGPARPPGGRAS